MDEKEIIMNVRKKREKYYMDQSSNKKVSHYISNLFTRVLLATVMLLIGVIVIKGSEEGKSLLEKTFFTTNISFAKISSYYDKYFGNGIVLGEEKEDDKMVFNEQLSYKEKEDYLNGVKLTVDDNYLVPSLKSGIVVFIGEKDNLGNVLIVQGVDGCDIWYGNINVGDIKLYDYIESGILLGETNGDFLYIMVQKNGEYLNYDEYFEES